MSAFEWQNNGIVELSSVTFSVSMIDSRNIMVDAMLNTILQKYKEILVMNSTLYGSSKNTKLEFSFTPESAVNNIMVGND